ncbi:unnamed protein product [Calypogeia fissa]
MQQYFRGLKIEYEFRSFGDLIIMSHYSQASQGLSGTIATRTDSSSVPNLRWQGNSVEPTTTAVSLLVPSSVAARQSRQQTNAESENVVAVGSYASNSTDDDDFQPELVVPVEGVTAQDEVPNLGGGGNVVDVRAPAAAPNWTNDFRQQEPSTVVHAEVAEPGRGQGEPNSGRSENGVDVRAHAAAPNITNDFRQEEFEVGMQAEAAGQAQGEPNSGEGENVVDVRAHAAASNSTNDSQQEEVQAEVLGQGEPNPGGRNIVVEIHALSSSSSSDDDFQEEVAVPVPAEVPSQREPNSNSRRGEDIAVAQSTIYEVLEALPVPAFGVVFDNVDRKRAREESARQLEVRSSQERNSNDGADDSVVCPICMEPWTNSGEHRICALACGHLFGQSCIKRWLRQAGRKVSKCPHCNKRAKLEDVRTLYVPRTLGVVDGDAQQLKQELRTVKAELLRVKSENKKLQQEVLQSKERNRFVQAPALQWPAENSATIHLRNATEPHNVTTGSEPVQNLRNKVILRTSLSELSSGQAFDSRNCSARPSGRQEQLHTGGGSNGNVQVPDAVPYPSSSRAGGVDNCGGSFQLQHVVPVHGGKVFDMDAESLTVIFSNKAEGIGTSFGLSKMSLLSTREIMRIDLPSGLGAIRDVRLSPSGIGGTGKCAVVASSSKKLSLISLDSNNLVLSYSLQSPPWSCAWDPYVPNLLYSGLQNGSLLLVDLRQTSSPVATLTGLSNRPIHTLQVLGGHSSVQANMGGQPFGGREILSASNFGISLWNVCSSVAGSEMSRPQRVFSDRELICVSLDYDCSVNTAVASFRRSPSAQSEPSSSSSYGQNSSQPIDTLLSGPSPAAIGYEEPSHWILSRSHGTSWSGMNESARTAESRPPWERIGAMVGNKSQSLMTRTAIISESKSTPRSKSLFACGDEGTNSVWLWDMKSCRLTDTLVPHQSPISDVKSVQIQGKDVLGCVSDGTFQIYRNFPDLS